MEKERFNKREYNKQYNKEHFDHMSFYAPKGTKQKLIAKASKIGLNQSEYIRYLIEKNIREGE